MSDPFIAECHRYSFFQLVRMLMRVGGSQIPPDGLPPILPGGDGPATREMIRFRPAANLGFPTADMEGVEAHPTPPGADVPMRYWVTVNFLGLYGPASPMPNHFTEEILWAGSEGQTVRDFLDLFHHRLISFVYRAWEKYRHHIQYTTVSATQGVDRFTQRMLCLIGLGTDGMRGAFDESCLPLLRVAGLLNGRPHSAVGLEGILRDHFEGIPIVVEPLIEKSVRIPDDSTARLGNRASRLSTDLCLGETVKDRAGTFRVTLGPLPVREFRRFLPDGEAFRRLVRIVRFSILDALEFDLRLLLLPGEAPPLVLSQAAHLPLGRMSWLTAGAQMQGDVILPTRQKDPLLGRTAIGVERGER